MAPTPCHGTWEKYLRSTKEISLGEHLITSHLQSRIIENNNIGCYFEKKIM
jgi:hypothetical protein